MVEFDSVLMAIWCLWFATVGACIGSFLNVLVYRLPRRESLTHPPSHCPRCNHLIRWYDNVPVIGWFKLWGKCRDCGMPISIRYPSVEGFCGILFGGVFMLFEQIVHPFWLLIVLTLFVSLLGCCILAVCLIAYDKSIHK